MHGDAAEWMAAIPRKGTPPSLPSTCFCEAVIVDGCGVRCGATRLAGASLLFVPTKFISWWHSLPQVWLVGGRSPLLVVVSSSELR